MRLLISRYHALATATRAPARWPDLMWEKTLIVTFIWKASGRRVGGGCCIGKLVGRWDERRISAAYIWCKKAMKMYPMIIQSRNLRIRLVEVTAYKMLSRSRSDDYDLACDDDHGLATRPHPNKNVDLMT